MSTWHADAEVAATPEIGLNVTDQLLESPVAKNVAELWRQ
jgi:hypothetical protein